MQRPLSYLQTDPEGVVELFLDAYRQGAFPMADFSRSRRESCLPGGINAGAISIIRWYSPDPRAVLPLDKVHVSRTLARLVRRPPFTFTSDASFERVIRACAEARPEKPGEPPNLPWLDETLIRAYCLMHEHGHAHSIEAWAEACPGEPAGRVLVGGVYGVHIGAAFFAESMFCRPPLGGTNASNLCLLQLVAHLRAMKFALMDVQIANPHTERFGVREVSRAVYLRRLASATKKGALWGTLQPEMAAERLGLGITHAASPSEEQRKQRRQQSA